MTQTARKHSYGKLEPASDKRPHLLHHERIPVCHVIEGSAWAGAEAQVATLARWQSRNPGFALHAIVLHEQRLARELRNAGAEVFVAEEGQKSFPELVLECSRFVSSRKIRILHSHCYKENIIALAVAYLSRVPHLVRTEHGIPEPYTLSGNLKHWCVLAADRVAARYTPDRIVGVSADLGRYWSKHANPKKVVVLRNGVDVERAASGLAPAEAKQRLGISEDSFVVGLVARLERIKRPDLFVATAASLAERIPNSRFVIAGAGRLEQSVRQLVANAGLQERILLLGARDDIYDVMRAIDVMLMCSDHEGIPMVVLEAMALGTAVVSRNVGGIPEVIEQGRNGVLVASDSPEALGAACLELYEQPELRSRLTQAALQDVRENYSAEKNAEFVCQLYRSICRRP